MSWERLWAEDRASEDIREQWWGFGMIRAEECSCEDIEVNCGEDFGLRNVHRSGERAWAGNGIETASRVREGC